MFLFAWQDNLSEMNCIPPTHMHPGLCSPHSLVHSFSKHWDAYSVSVTVLGTRNKEGSGPDCPQTPTPKGRPWNWELGKLSRVIRDTLGGAHAVTRHNQGKLLRGCNILSCSLKQGEDWKEEECLDGLFSMHLPGIFVLNSVSYLPESLPLEVFLLGFDKRANDYVHDFYLFSTFYF